MVCLACFPSRHPLLAIQWASLDVLSGGRTILVVCNGGSAKWGGAYATELVACHSPDTDEKQHRKGLCPYHHY